MYLFISLLSGFILFKIIFSAPLDLPMSFLGDSYREENSQSLKTEFTNLLISVVVIYIIGRIQGFFLDTYCPMRGEKLDEIEQTILSNSDFSPFFLAIKFLLYGGFGSLSIKEVCITIIINFIAIVLLAFVVNFLGSASTELEILTVFKPFNNIVFLILGILICSALCFLRIYNVEHPFRESVRWVLELLYNMHYDSFASSVASYSITAPVAKLVIERTNLKKAFGFDS